MSFYAQRDTPSPPPFDDLDAFSDGGNGSKRQRISRACDRCRRKKVKCDGGHPTCAHCAAIDVTCTYLDTAKKRGPPKGYIDAIESRLRAAERLLRELVLGDSGAARLVVDTLHAPGGVSAAALTDGSGKMFGSLTMDDLQMYAAESPARAPRPHASPTTAAAATDANWAEPLASLERGVGHLTLDQTGSLRYLGGSSGWDIVNRSLHAAKDSPRLTRSSEGPLRWPPVSVNTARDPEPPGASASSDAGSPRQRMDVDDDMARDGPQRPRGSNAPDNSSTSSSSVRQWTTSGDHATALVPRNMPPCGKPPMPSRDEQMRMLVLYFRHVHPVFPILYKSHFLARALDRATPGIPALMSAVFAAASTYMVREARSKGDLAQVRMQMATHFLRAKLYLDEQYTHNTIASVQTLLLMSVYEQGTMSTRSWLYSGMAIRKAYDLGLHRDVGVAKHEGLAVISPADAQIRQRAWWGCYVMDIMVSATLGRPTTIRDFTFDVPYPSDYGGDGDELLVNSPPARDLDLPLPNAQHQRNPRQEPLPGSPHQATAAPAIADRLQGYAALAVGESEPDGADVSGGARAEKARPHGVYYLDLLHILGHILTEMYMCKPHSSYVARYCLRDLHSQADQLVLLDNELRVWAASLPPELQYPTDDILAARPARCVYVALLHLVYNTAMILLHRPFIARLEGPHGSDTGGASGSSPLPSHSICTVSAQMISQIGQAFIQDSQVVIMPFLTFMMFTAGTMHLNNIIVSADGATARRFLKRTLDVMSRLGAHWQVSYKCYTMLNTLVRTNQIVFDPVVDSSDAEIQAIKARCRMIAQVAREAHESWLQGRAQHPHPRSRRSSTSTAGPTPAPPENTTRPPVPIAARTDSMPVNAASGADSFRDQGRPLSYIPGLRRSSTSALSALPVAARPDGRAQDRSLWMRRNPDDRGSLAVPATAYSSALRPDPPGRSSSMGMAGGLPLSLPAAAGSAAGQFVPTLEFFANADYPLGIGGPNGVAPTAQPLGQGAGDGLEQLAGLLGDLEAKPYSMGLGLHMLATPDTPALQLSNGAAANPVLQPGGEPGLYMWSQLRAGSSAASAPATAAAMALGSLAQPRAGFGGSFTSDDMLRDLLCSGPVSFDLSELANRAGLLAGAHPAGPTSDTQSAEYASQLFRMLNGGGSSTDTSQP